MSKEHSYEDDKKQNSQKRGPLTPPWEFTDIATTTTGYYSHRREDSWKHSGGKVGHVDEMHRE